MEIANSLATKKKKNVSCVLTSLDSLSTSCTAALISWSRSLADVRAAWEEETRPPQFSPPHLGAPSSSTQPRPPQEEQESPSAASPPHVWGTKRRGVKEGAVLSWWGQRPLRLTFSLRDFSSSWSRSVDSLSSFWEFLCSFLSNSFWLL